jgi:hypothetical protein
MLTKLIPLCAAVKILEAMKFSLVEHVEVL